MVGLFISIPPSVFIVLITILGFAIVKKLFKLALMVVIWLAIFFLLNGFSITLS